MQMLSGEAVEEQANEAGEERGHDVGVGGGDVGVLGRVGLDVEEADLPRSWRPSPMA